MDLKYEQRLARMYTIEDAAIDVPQNVYTIEDAAKCSSKCEGIKF